MDESRYLADLLRVFDAFLEKAKTFDSTHESDLKAQVALNRILSKEEELRRSYEIGARFNVLRTQLKLTLDKVSKIIDEGNEAQYKNVQNKTDAEIKDETLIYVYLFNSQGFVLSNWENMLLPNALIDHSVNRPIYQSKEHVESSIRAKPNSTKHAYIEIAIEKSDVLVAKGESIYDQQGYPLLRIKQGSLKVENIRGFYHEGNKYSVTAKGLVKVP